MAILSDNLLNSIVQFIDEKVDSADYTIGSNTRKIGIRRAIIDGKTIKKHVYLTTKDPTGTITRVRLLDKDGKVLAQLNQNVEHKKNTGRLFEFSIKVEEG